MQREIETMKASQRVHVLRTEMKQQEQVLRAELKEQALRAALEKQEMKMALQSASEKAERARVEERLERVRMEAQIKEIKAAMALQNAKASIEKNFEERLQQQLGLRELQRDLLIRERAQASDLWQTVCL